MRADPFALVLGCACFIPEPGAEHTPSIIEEKASDRRKWLGFLVNVWFWSALALTLNQRVRRPGLRRP